MKTINYLLEFLCIRGSQQLREQSFLMIRHIYAHVRGDFVLYVHRGGGGGWPQLIMLRKWVGGGIL